MPLKTETDPTHIIVIQNVKYVLTSSLFHINVYMDKTEYQQNYD